MVYLVVGFALLLASIPLALLVGAPLVLRRDQPPLIDEVYADARARSYRRTTHARGRSQGPMVPPDGTTQRVFEAAARTAAAVSRAAKRECMKVISQWKSQRSS